jgi:DNA-binding CsgD family transcriptional regulator
MIHLHLDRGDLVAARQVADGLRPEWHMGEGGRLLHEAVVRLLLAEGEPERALVLLEQTADPIGIANPVWAPWRGLRADALAALGRTGEALVLAREHVAGLRRWGAPSFLGAGVRRLGELEGSTPLLREAEALLRDSRATLELARARVSLGSAPEVPDHEAVPLLEQALVAAAASGAEGVRTAAAAELARRGRPVPLTTGDHNGLTRTEHRVLDLTRSGLSPHEVAQHLFLTPGTVARTLEAASRRAGDR